MALDVVNEQSTYIVVASFTDEEGDPVIPASASYRIDDIGNETVTEIKADTAFVPVAATYEIEVDPADNTLVDETNERELRLITITYTWGSAREGNGEYKYWVKNMGGITAT